jgi:hypothetical protein
MRLEQEKRKVDQIRDAWNASDQIGALRVAAKFFDRSSATKAFQHGMDAHNHPDFYRQIHKLDARCSMEPASHAEPVWRAASIERGSLSPTHAAPQRT